jgi:hypothetical protein
MCSEPQSNWLYFLELLTKLGAIWPNQCRPWLTNWSGLLGCRLLMLDRLQSKNFASSRSAWVVHIWWTKSQSACLSSPCWLKYQWSCVWTASCSWQRSNLEVCHHSKIHKKIRALKEKIASWLGRQSFTIIYSSNTHLHLYLIRWYYSLYRCWSK